MSQSVSSRRPRVTQALDRLRTRSDLFAVMIAAVGIVLSVGALAVAGVIEGGDTHRYITAAETLLSGELPTGDARSFPGYVIVVAASLGAGAGLVGVILFQVVVAGIATLAMHATGKRVAGPLAGLVAAGLFTFNVDIARWHLYVLTESLYISSVAITVWAVVESAYRGRRFLFVPLSGVAVSALIRPNGWLLVPVVFVYVAHNQIRTRRGRWLTVVGAGAVLVVALVTLPGGVGQAAEGLAPPYKHLVNGEVIWEYEEARLEMPPAPVTGDEGVADAINYALDHPVATARLAATRFGVSMAHVRPFYSRAHNLAIVATLVPMYMGALAGVVLLRRQAVIWLLVAVFVVHMLTVAATFADWDGRFLLYPMPALTLLAVAGFAEGLRRLRRSQNSEDEIAFEDS